MDFEDPTVESRNSSVHLSFQQHPSEIRTTTIGTEQPGLPALGDHWTIVSVTNDQYGIV